MKAYKHIYKDTMFTLIRRSSNINLFRYILMNDGMLKNYGRKFNSEEDKY
ncbi:MAG: hypothetical protein IPG21_14340 [Saprospiraceae bacterium]|nr:hypothetical protein [Candidatus Vicinibacter affinis]